MKMLKHILSAAALLVLAAACNHDPDELVLPASDLSIANHSKVVVNGLTIDEDFTLTWSPVRFAAPAAVDYTVEAQLSDGYVLLGSTQATHFTCKNSELFDVLGISLAGDYDIDFRITAASASGETKQKTLTVPFEYTKISYLWIPGAYQGWDFSKPISRLLQGDDGIFRGFVHLPEGGEFKFSSQPNWDGIAYGPGEEEGTLDTDAEAGNLSVAAGLYYVELDIEALTYVLLPLTSVSLIGEGVGGWSDGDDVEMVYDAASKSWVGFADAAAGKEYKVRFNKAWNITVDGKEYDCSLGGDPQELAFKGSNLSVEGEGGITAFTLSIFDYPYNIKEGAVEENDEVLYLVSSVDEWNYLASTKLNCLEEGKFYGLANFLGAASPEVLLARLQTPLGTRYGGNAADLEAYLGGAEATPIAAAAGLNFYAVDLAADPKALYETAITDAAVVLAGDDATTLTMTADGAGKWTLTHEFAAVGKFSIALNGGTITCGGTDYPAVLGGSCTGLTLGGDALNMIKGEHTLLLDFTAMTLSIDGEVADLQLYPETMGVTGSFQGWAPDAAPRLWGDTATGNYWGYVSMFGEGDADVEFKFTTQGNWDGPNYGSTGTEGELSNDNGAGNLTIAPGLYRLDANIAAMTYTVTPLTKVGLIGNGVGSWDDDQAELVRDPEDGLYKAKGVVCAGGEFKIRFNGNWDENLGGDPEDMTIGGSNIAITAGTYDFVLDLTHTPYKVTFTAAE